MRALFFAVALFLVFVPLATSWPEPGKSKAKKVPVPKAPADVADLTGYWVCRGQEASGKKYSGIVTLKKANEVYLITWTMITGSHFKGIALRQGDQLAASWALTSEQGLVRGVNLYRIEVTAKGPRLVGNWASVPGPGIQQREVLTFLKAMDPPEK